jgi:hypothetical protein
MFCVKKVMKLPDLTVLYSTYTYSALHKETY